MNYRIHLAALLAFVPGLLQAAPGTSFYSPQDAQSALLNAMGSNNQQALLRILGTDASDLVNSGDPTYDAFMMGKLSKAAAKNCTISQRDSKTIFFNLGANAWRLPIPLVQQQDNMWVFNAGYATQQVLGNRIRRNQANARTVCRAFVNGELAYARQDHDGDGVTEYAQKFISSPDKQDGLYWPTQPVGPASPIWSLVEKARDEGYVKRLTGGVSPYQGYVFRILREQGSNAPGGQFSYMVGPNMTRGFALIAYPVKYGDSGKKTFLVNQSGQVLEKDMGPDTVAIAKAVMSYNPDASWVPAKL